MKIKSRNSINIILSILFQLSWLNQGIPSIHPSKDVTIPISKTYCDYGFSFSYPDSWNIMPLDESVIAIMTDPFSIKLKEPIACTFKVDIDSTTSNLRFYFENYKRKWSNKEGFTNWKIVSLEKIHVQNHLAYQLITTYNLSSYSLNKRCKSKVTLIQQKDRIIELSTSSSEVDFEAQKSSMDFIFQSFKFEECHKHKEKTGPKSSKQYLNSDVVYYNLGYYKREIKPKQMYILLYDFKQGTYQKLKIITKHYTYDKIWRTIGNDFFSPNDIDKSLVFTTDSVLIKRKLSNGGKVSFEYNKDNRLVNRQYYSNTGNLGSSFRFSYPNDTTEVLTDYSGKTTKIFNREGLLISFLKESKYGQYYNVYDYGDNRLPKTWTWYSDNKDTSRFDSKFHITYKFNKHGDWVEMLVTREYPNTPTTEPYLKIERHFE